MDEFELIATFFAPQEISRADVILGIGDDCALIAPPPHQQLAITTDTFVNGVHFPVTTDPFDIGYKALAVNLSDLAAMGATPAWVSLAMTLPAIDAEWLAAFRHGFMTLATLHSVQLIGGDITRGPLSITITAHGFVPTQQALRRQGAKPGDSIYVTGTLGDAGFALQQLSTPTVSAHCFDEIMQRLNQPTPRVQTGVALRDIAHSAIDISDGLVADLQHILTQSQVGATVWVDQLPLSSELTTHLSREKAIAYALNAGDDYELCFTVPPEKEILLTKMMAAHSPPLTKIGVITHDKTLSLQLTDGSIYHGDIQGYKHFR